MKNPEKTTVFSRFLKKYSTSTSTILDQSSSSSLSGTSTKLSQKSCRNGVTVASRVIIPRKEGKKRREKRSSRRSIDASSPFLPRSRNRLLSFFSFRAAYRWRARSSRIVEGRIVVDASSIHRSGSINCSRVIGTSASAMGGFAFLSALWMRDFLRRSRVRRIRDFFFFSWQIRRWEFINYCLRLFYLITFSWQFVIRIDQFLLAIIIYLSI